ncbi:MAG: hypothetical protein HQ511_10320 [Rhodospirillales bacterium]|nr:hypothetical protein [Rhodospirillales bacterium]
MKKVLVALIAIGFFALEAAPAFADPPPWAPAWGARGHGKGKSKRMKNLAPVIAPFGLDGGHCNRERLGQVLGGAAGGALGSTLGKGDGRTVAIIGGTLLGVLVGGNIGRVMDQVDQGCVGQVLEHVPDGQTIAWKNPDAEAGHNVTPTRTFETNDGRYCREYTSVVMVSGTTQNTYGTACRRPDGAWKLMN